jgi:(R,R)-butanediol dehydrogenase/meso-butanediol dehydrogenase/diacetyl reductase/L-iditol 2-dehydrogenase
LPERHAAVCVDLKKRGSAQADYVVWSESQVYRIPDNLSMQQAALTEPFNIAFHAVEVSEMRPGTDVAVCGAGGIGLMLIAVAKSCGASSVTVLEPVEAKRELAKKMGADFAIDPITEDVSSRAREITNGLGYACVFEASGNGASAGQRPEDRRQAGPCGLHGDVSKQV